MELGCTPREFLGRATSMEISELIAFHMLQHEATQPLSSPKAPTSAQSPEAQSEAIRRMVGAKKKRAK